MIRHQLLLVLRNIRRFKMTFVINVIGLSSGLACVLLICLWVQDELKMDKFHKRDQHLYQVMKNDHSEVPIQTEENTPGMLARALAEEFPEVESAVSVFPPAAHTFHGVLSTPDAKIKAESKFADRDFFSIFSFNLLAGNADHVLNEKNALVVSRSVAVSLFGTVENAVGKTVDWEGERNAGEFAITGVFEDVPSSSSIRFDVVFSYELVLQLFPFFNEWKGSGPSTFVVLRARTDVAEFNSRIREFARTKNDQLQLTLFARPYSNRYLYSNYENGTLAGGRIEYVRLLSSIAALILIIACINYMNLSTARVSRRFKEVGIKKSFGASRAAVALQFLCESILVTVISFLVAVLVVDLALPAFNAITGKTLRINVGTDMILLLSGLLLVTSIVAGGYPALFVSKFNPVEILRGRSRGIHRNSTSELLTRHGLVVCQFVVSIVLAVCVIVLYRQMEFVQSRDLGIIRDNVIIFPAEGRIASHSEAFLSELRTMSGVANASYMDGDLVGLHGGTSAVSWQGKTPDQSVDFELFHVGFSWIETFGIEVKEGRSFSHSMCTEGTKIIFNETAIQQMGITDPIGKTVRLWGEEKEIIGIVKDFHFESLYNKVKPLFLIWSEKSNRNIVVRIEKGSEQATISKLSEMYKEFSEGLPFSFRFLDHDYESLYASEHRVTMLARYFAFLAVLISCLGILGLAAFTIEKRVKEIGIRKVIGASPYSIVIMLSGVFNRIVFIAVLIALPLSYIIAVRWLDGFAYRIELEWWYFGGAGVLALMIAWLAVGTQAIAASVVNPIKYLRDE